MSGPLTGSSAAIAASAVRVGLIALGLLSLALGLAACSQAVEPPSSAEPGVELRTGELVRYDAQGQPLWTLEAQRIEHLPDARKTQAEGVRLVLYDAEGRKALTVMAEKLLWDHSAGTLELSGGVRGMGAEGLRFSTERVRWDEATQTLQGEGPVEIEAERDDLRLAGESFEFHPKDGALIVQNAHLQLFLER